MIRYLLLAAFLAIVSDAGVANSKIFVFNITMSSTKEIQALNKVFKKDPNYFVKTVAVKDDVKAVVLVKEILVKKLQDYLNANNIKYKVKPAGEHDRFPRDLNARENVKI